MTPLSTKAEWSFDEDEKIEIIYERLRCWQIRSISNRSTGSGRCMWYVTDIFTGSVVSGPHDTEAEARRGFAKALFERLE